MPEQTFTTKKDWWLAGPVWAVILGVPLLVVAAAFASGGLTGAMLALPPALIAPVIMFGLTWPVRYHLNDEELLIRSGPFLRWRIPVAQITAIAGTHNPLSSPAWSLDRLRIDYGDGKWIMISPEPRAQFLEAIALRSPRLAAAGILTTA